MKRDLSPQLPLWRDMLKIGLPAGAEFAMMAVYLMLVYAIARPFGAAAQAGFGIGMRVVQALFMPVVALGFSVAPVAGQNVGARLAHRVKAVFKDASMMAGGWMLLMAVLCNIRPAALIGLFSDDPAVVAVGDEYLRIISLNFVASGLIFVCSSMFQAMGNTMPSLIASVTRVIVIAVPALLLAGTPGFELKWIWYISVGAVLLQLGDRARAAPSRIQAPPRFDDGTGDRRVGAGGRLVRRLSFAGAPAWDELLERRLDLGWFEPKRAGRALVGHLAFSIDHIQPIRPTGIQLLDAIVGLVYQRRQLDSQLRQADTGHGDAFVHGSSCSPPARHPRGCR